MASSTYSTTNQKTNRFHPQRHGRSIYLESFQETQALGPNSREVSPNLEYTVRDIIDEDATRYLIDWEDSSQGAQYSPTWEPKSNANYAAIEAWERRKCTSSVTPREGQHSILDTEFTGSPSLSEESQPVRVVKRRKLQHSELQSVHLVAADLHSPRNSGNNEVFRSDQPLPPVRDEVEDSYEKYKDERPASTQAGHPNPVSSAPQPNQRTSLRSATPSALSGSERWSEAVQETPKIHTTSRRAASELTIPDSQEAERLASQTISGLLLEGDIYSQDSRVATAGTSTSTGITDPLSPRHSRLRKTSKGYHLEEIASEETQNDTFPSDPSAALREAGFPNSWEGDYPSRPEVLSGTEMESHQETPSITSGMTSAQRLKQVRAEAAAAVMRPVSVSGSPIPPFLPVSETKSIVSTESVEIPSANGLAQLSSVTVAPSEAPIVQQTISSELSATLAPNQVSPPSEHALPEPQVESPARASTSCQHTEVPEAPNEVSDQPNYSTKRKRSSSPHNASVMPTTEEDQLREAMTDCSTEGDEGTLKLVEHENTHVVLLPISSMVREMYEVRISKSKSSITSILTSERVDLHTEARLKSMLLDLELLCSHQDLLVSEQSLTQDEMSDEDRTRWAMNCSTKCIFLREVLVGMKKDGASTRIAILARPGRMIDILESILKVEQICYKRSEAGIEVRHSGPRVTLLSTDIIHGVYAVERVDVVIAFDNSYYDCDAYTKVLREDLVNPSQLSPVLSLAIINSVEHIRLCLPQSKSQRDTAALVSYVKQTRKETGVTDPRDPDLFYQASLLAKWLMQTNHICPLPTAKPLELDPIANLQSFQRSESPTQSYINSSVEESSPKRFTDDGTDDRAKRMRTTASYLIGIRNEQELNDSSTIDPRGSNGFIHENVVKTTIPSLPETVFKTLRDQVVQLQEQLQRQAEAFEDERKAIATQAREESEARLDERLMKYEERIKALNIRNTDLEQSTTWTARGYQQLDVKCREATHRYIAAEKKVATAESAAETWKFENSKLKDEKVDMAARLAEAKARLLSHEVPEVATFEALRCELDAMKAEKIKLDSRITGFTNEQAFFRDNYQRSSAQVSELTTEVSDLRDQLTTVLRKADEVKLKCIEKNNELQTNFYLAKIKELKGTVSMREMELRGKQVELDKVKSFGRRETRGTSMVPGSPRLGGVSRGGSPAPGNFPVGRFDHLRQG